MNTYFVYEDWTTESTPRCFYVGKGDRGRVKILQRNNHHKNIVKSLGIERKIVFATSVERLALDVEIELIAEHKTFVNSFDYVFGANYTKGGEGTSGFKPSQTTRQKMSRSAKTRPPISDETRWRLKNRPISVFARQVLSRRAQTRAITTRLEWIQIHDRPVSMLMPDGTYLRDFSSIKVASELTGTSRTMISLVLNGHRATAKGHVWRYVGT